MRLLFRAGLLFLARPFFLTRLFPIIGLRRSQLRLAHRVAHDSYLQGTFDCLYVGVSLAERYKRHFGHCIEALVRSESRYLDVVDGHSNMQESRESREILEFHPKAVQLVLTEPDEGQSNVIV